MGRHRRSGTGAAAEERTAGTARRGAGHGKKRVPLPVRAGLLGVSAAVAVGAVAMASGILPGGGDTYTAGDTTGGEQVASGGAPDLLTQGDAGADPTGRASSSPTSRGSERPAAPKRATPSASTPATATPEAGASPSTATPSTGAPAPKTAPKTAPKAAPRTAAPRTSAPAPAPTTAAPATDDRGSSGTSVQADVLALVNKERATVGCSPLTLSSSLTALAQDFSQDMAERGFFAHTDPDGKTPWDRAASAGVSNLAAENIARGQADAEAVMESWMNSSGHRANILNCDYKTLGVGVYIGDGGPWWTQDFGF
ncbi:CAP domain-containing protein [uncultured Streptomyces sp.]|uniref:CAP domain-containing protein n=1 Tax=uncultured Streptomyces sp. TaxID=174707 RepID=UPI00262A8355|nr:CAP domain-containing protein [uncultured Streptomyces sp.]